MDEFFNAKSIAVIGASTRPGKIGYEIVGSLAETGFEGNIYPIHLKEEPIHGLKSYKSIGDVPGDVDLAVVVTASSKAPQVIEECGRKGVKAVVIISGGFKELNEEGQTIEKETVETARRFGIRIIGPNCVGIFNPRKKIDTFFQPHYAMSRPKAGNIAVLSQSGTYGLTILEWCFEADLGVSKFVSYGNKADISEIEMIRYLESDGDTGVIGLYLEGLDDGRDFLETAGKVSVEKPIVALKTGRTSEGSKAVKSHTGALAGDIAVFEGAMRQCGVISTNDISEMFEVLKVLSLQPLPNGGRVAMVTNGAGPCIMAIDKMQNTNLSLARLNDKTLEDLREVLPSYCVFDNPLDITGSADSEMYRVSIEALIKDENVDIVMPFFVFQDGPIAHTADKMLESMKAFSGKKTMVCVAAGSGFTSDQARKYHGAGVPVIATANNVVAALNRIVWYADWLRAHR
jgi:3-hydroxypropionyl-CoA synthetase (ADP-forming)